MNNRYKVYLGAMNLYVSQFGDLLMHQEDSHSLPVVTLQLDYIARAVLQHSSIACIKLLESCHYSLEIKQIG